jgi:ribosomal-protein-alanine N-acetyltransferase
MNALKTERLAIRQFELSDAAFILRLVNDESFLHFIGDKGVRTLEDACDYLSDGPIASYHAHGFGLFHVAEKLSGEPIGMCGLLKRDGQQHPDIGFAFLPEYCAQGFAYESAVAVLEYGHLKLDIDTIVAFVNPDNERSIRLLERLGLAYAGQVTLEGIARQQKSYSSVYST